ncbi:MAG: NAD(P)H-hydrate dehydratase, partial [Planctomycetes bacterium]|nr:NAD(P)H-hydrate dehydratase [Planctomycetota bacterium]
QGAIRGGAGLVTGVLPRSLMTPFTVAVPAATTADRDADGIGACASADAIVCGPGLPPDEAHRLVRALRIAADAPLVLDAGALDVSTLLDAHAAISTPHPGEAARLLDSTSADVQADRDGAVRELVRRFGGTCVLKGANTLVCDGERLYENRTGNCGLATGGTGDVLSGLIGAFLARGMEPFDAACAAVHVHGAAGDLVAERLSPDGLCATDLPLAIAEVLGR